MKAGEGVKVTLQVFSITVQVRGRPHALPLYTRNVVAFCNPIGPGGDNYLVSTYLGDVLTDTVFHFER